MRLLPFSNRWLIPVMISMLAASGILMASDLAREQRISEQISGDLIEGKVIMLPTGTEQFLAIYTRTRSEAPKGTVILLHGRGLHPNWMHVMYPLRTGLTDYGWHTLSLQMPVLAPDATFVDYNPILHEAGPRIDAAIRFLKKEGNRNIVLLAHNCGANMAFAWLDKNGARDIDAYIGLSQGTRNFTTYRGHPPPLDRINIPLLDVYGDIEDPAYESAEHRQALITAGGNPHSRQVHISKADGWFVEYESTLVNTVGLWLSNLNLDP